MNEQEMGGGGTQETIGARATVDGDSPEVLRGTSEAAVAPQTITDAPRPPSHLGLIQGGAGDTVTTTVPPQPLTFRGQTLPAGARVVQGGDGKATIHLPEHMAMPAMQDKLAIIGFTPSRAAAPWGDPTWEFAGLNALYVHEAEMPLQRFTRWFDVHDMAAVADERLSSYRKLQCPVYFQDVVPGMPNSVRFPKREIETFLADTYFTNSISWMIGWGLLMGFKEIGVWGVDMSQDQEYRFQRPNVEYWIGRARGMGVKVTVAETSDLLKASHQYGFGTDHGLRAKLLERQKEFKSREAGIAAEIQRLTLAQATVNGALQNVEWMLQSWCVADHTSMQPDVAKIAPGAAIGGGKAA
ncbi:MAG: hypothetical protein WC718_07250 [Phycisphaerales bacterium]|jgi:hypothetical protein